MKSSISERVVKSYNVEVSTPRMVECLVDFQKLSNCLTVLSFDEDSLDREGFELSDKKETGSQDDLDAKAQFEAELEGAREQAARIMAEAEANAQKLLAQAETASQEILAKAEVDAQEVLARAQSELDRLRQEVLDNAQSEVYPAAKAEGYQEGKQAGETEGIRLTEHANRLFHLAQRAVQEEYAKVDQELLHLAIKIAERIVRSTLAIEPQRIVDIIQALTLLPIERQGWRLHVSSEDAQWLEEKQLPCPWVVDDTLSFGDCFLECQEGVFDGRLEAQLDKLEHTLREELEYGGVESINPDGESDRTDFGPRQGLEDCRPDGGVGWTARQCG